jgi:hypothetical protein
MRVAVPALECDQMPATKRGTCDPCTGSECYLVPSNDAFGGRTRLWVTSLASRRVLEVIRLASPCESISIPTLLALVSRAHREARQPDLLEREAG